MGGKKGAMNYRALVLLLLVISVVMLVATVMLSNEEGSFVVSMGAWSRIAVGIATLLVLLVIGVRALLAKAHCDYGS